jgi:hypothetical protein
VDVVTNRVRADSPSCPRQVYYHGACCPGRRKTADVVKNEPAQSTSPSASMCDANITQVDMEIEDMVETSQPDDDDGATDLEGTLPTLSRQVRPAPPFPSLLFTSSHAT